jgi:hypothetical protein
MIGGWFLPTYADTGFPFSVALRMSDYVHGFSEISITGVDVEYGDNSVDHVALNEVGRFSRNELLQCGQAELSLKGVVRHRSTTALTIIGEFRSADGSTQPFRMRRDLQLDSDFKFGTWYDVIASI